MLADAWELYNLAVLSNCGKHSQATERGRWKKHIKPFLGTKKVKDISSYDLLIIRNKLENKGLSPQTVKHCLSLIRRIIYKYVEWKKLDILTPSFRGVMPKFDNRSVRYLTKSEFIRLSQHLSKIEENENWKHIAIFAVNTGLRRSEIFNIKVSDVNFHDRFLFVRDTKSKTNRTIPLNDIVIDLLSNIPIPDNAYIFIKKNPKIFSRAVKESGLNNNITDRRNKVVFHTLRHTFASWLVQEGVPLSVVSELLGHSNINQTMRYAHLAPSQHRSAVDLIRQKLGHSKNGHTSPLNEKNYSN